MALVATGADVGIKKVKYDQTRSNQLICTGYGRAFVATGADVGRKNVKVAVPLGQQ